MANKKVQFLIDGMHCGACAAGIQMLLLNTEGVINASVDYENKRGGVEFDETKLKIEDIVKSIESLGYKATPI